MNKPTETVDYMEDKAVAVKLQIIRDTMAILGMFTAPMVWIFDRFYS